MRRGSLRNDQRRSTARQSAHDASGTRFRRCGRSRAHAGTVRDVWRRELERRPRCSRGRAPLGLSYNLAALRPRARGERYGRDGVRNRTHTRGGGCLVGRRNGHQPSRREGGGREGRDCLEGGSACRLGKVARWLGGHSGKVWDCHGVSSGTGAGVFGRQLRQERGRRRKRRSRQSCLAPSQSVERPSRERDGQPQRLPPRNAPSRVVSSSGRAQWTTSRTPCARITRVILQHRLGFSARRSTAAFVLSVWPWWYVRSWLPTLQIRVDTRRRRRAFVILRPGRSHYAMVEEIKPRSMSAGESLAFSRLGTAPVPRCLAGRVQIGMLCGLIRSCRWWSVRSPDTHGEQCPRPGPVAGYHRPHTAPALRSPAAHGGGAGWSGQSLLLLLAVASASLAAPASLLELYPPD